MKDYIDVRNQKEKMARSIIKRRNVVYVPPEEMNQKQRELQEREARLEREAMERKKAEEVLRRLEEEQHLEEQKKQKEIESLLKNQESLPQEGAILSQSELDRILGEAEVKEENGNQPEESVSCKN